LDYAAYRRVEDKGFFYVESIGIIKAKNTVERKSRRPIYCNDLKMRSRDLMENPILI